MRAGTGAQRGFDPQAAGVWALHMPGCLADCDIVLGLTARNSGA
ncbi:hypothetical protein PATSB16_12370 [Pandoraea thiooxydans]|nr:hypothetical protein PATSB16_12370 [Pandoraea thiooxydans]